MNSRWSSVPFSQLLSRIDRGFEISDAEVYRCVGVRWYGEGAFIREEKLGADIRRKRQSLVRAGDIIYNKLFAWKGSFAVASPDVDGCIASDKFPAYRHDLDALELDWLAWYFRTPDIASQAELLSKGAAAISKLTLNPPDFFNLTIPLPPIGDQRRLVHQLENTTTAIRRVRELRRFARSAASVLMASFLSKLLANAPMSGRLADVLLESPRNGWSARCDNQDDGTAVLTLGAVTGFHYKEDAYKTTSEPTVPNAHYWLQAGDLLITRSNTPDLVGHAAIYNGSPTPCIYPDLMMRLSVDERVADKQFVHAFLRSATVRDHIADKAKGTSPTMKKISQKTVADIPYPSGLSLSQQRSIVSAFDAVESKLNAVLATQVATSSHLDRLSSSLLHAAFNGDL